ncbi:WSC-domain-containing protein [Auricularia subglabra TFB-10046 SS5]|nr:WSC-domain-containing protein [Auricularia subglabra TFB-10046 SS5]
MWPSALVSISLAVLFAQDASAFFRMPCGSPLVLDRADPFDFNMTFNTARQSTCATCMAKQDLSNYWTPTLFFRAQNGSFHRVKQVGGMTVYYLQRRDNDAEKLHAFPEGFRMLAGNPALRSYNPDDVTQNAVTHVCLGGPENGEWPWLPKANCPNGLRTQVFFPSCWNGKDLDSPDHKSHVSYPSKFNNGKCPESHPVRLVSIFFEVMWDVNEWADQWWNADGLGHPLVLSNGDPTGYGFHGDFLNGWDVDVLQRAVDECNNNSGSMQDCGVLELRTNDEMKECEVNTRVPDTLNGWIPRLPGCNKVTVGPENAKMEPPSACGASEEILPKGASPLTAVSGWTTLGCASDEGDRALPKGIDIDNTTPTSCTAACAAAGYTFAGIEYGRECYCGNDFDTSRLGATRCNMPCEGDENALCGGGKRLAVYQQGGSAPAPPPGPKPPVTPVPEPTEDPEPVPTATPTPAEPPVAGGGGAGGEEPIPTEAPEPVPTEAPEPVPTEAPEPEEPSETATEAPEPTSTPEPPPEPEEPAPTSEAPLPPPTETEAPVPPPAETEAPAPGSGSSAFPSPDEKWESLGCFVDPLRPRALRGSGMWSGLPLTPTVCIDHCATLNFSYAGTEYGGECYCGNELTEGTVAAPDSDCTKACEGDQSAICGGPGRLNLYKYMDGTPSGGSSSSRPTEIDNVFPSPADGWNSLGCWYDPVTPRALQGKRITDDNMTPALCVERCASRNFAYAATEFGGECYCGNEILGAVKVDAAECKISCKGDNAQKCGAAGRLNLYHKGDGNGSVILKPNPMPHPPAELQPNVSGSVTSSPSTTSSRPRKTHRPHRPWKYYSSANHSRRASRMRFTGPHASS